MTYIVLTDVEEKKSRMQIADPICEPSLRRCTRQQGSFTCLSARPSTSLSSVITMDSSTPARDSVANEESSAIPVEEKPRAETEVTNLVNNLSSWWGSLSTRPLGETLEAARKNVQESTTGFVKAAQSELHRFEQSLEEAQKKARDDVKAGSAASKQRRVSEEGVEAGQGKGKGKGRANEEEIAREKEPESEEGDEEDDEEQVAMVDANGDLVGGRDPVRGPKSPSSATSGSFELEQQLEKASELFSSFTKSFQSDPRIQSIQKSLVQAGNSVQAQLKQATGSIEGDQTQSTKAITSSIQSSLPHLSWAQSQALAEKYWTKSEEFAKELVQEVKELVQVLPPEHEEAQVTGEIKEAKGDLVFDASPTEDEPAAMPSAAKVRAPATSASSVATPAASERSAEPSTAAKVAAKVETQPDDNGPTESNSANGLQTFTRPPGDTWDDSDEETTPPASEKAIEPAKTEEKGKKASKGADEDEDSDWE